MPFLWFLSRFRSPLANGIFQFFTLFGEELLVVGVVCALYWLRDKKGAIRIGLAYFAAGIAVQTLKILFCVPRPWILDPDFEAVASALGTATGYSFPSGHSQSAASLWGVLGLQCKGRGKKTLCFALVAAVGFSRMFLGVHTPKDVAVGILLGLFAAVLVCSEQTGRLAERHQKALCLSLGLIGAALFVFAVLRIHTGAIEMKEGLDCCKAAGAGIGFAAGWYVQERAIAWEPADMANRFGIGGQIALYLTGLLSALLWRAALKPLMGGTVWGDALRYAVLVLWIVAIFPAMAKRWNGWLRRGKNTF